VQPLQPNCILILCGICDAVREILDFGGPQMATEGHAMPSVTSLFAGWVIFNFVLKDSEVKMHLYT